jgi:16S rRNA G1207 methylase RsmC
MTGEHYFTEAPQTPASPRSVHFTVHNREFSLVAAGGVFSANRVDPGTMVLLRKAPAPGPRGGIFLDLGCGYGAISVVLASGSPATRVYAVDVNTRALELVRANAEALEVADRVTALTPDEVPDGVLFDEIWSNPPIRVGKPELHDMLLRWLPRLAPGGTAWLVVARNLGADSLQSWLGEQGYQADRYASQKGYRVLRVTAPE